MLVTIARTHGEDDWRLILGPNATREAHKELVNSVRFSSFHRTYAEIAHFDTHSMSRKFHELEGVDPDSSSSSSSSSSEGA